MAQNLQILSFRVKLPPGFLGEGGAVNRKDLHSYCGQSEVRHESDKHCDSRRNVLWDPVFHAQPLWEQVTCVSFTRHLHTAWEAAECGSGPEKQKAKLCEVIAKLSIHTQQRLRGNGCTDEEEQSSIHTGKWQAKKENHSLLQPHIHNVWVGN